VHVVFGALPDQTLIVTCSNFYILPKKLC